MTVRILLQSLRNIGSNSEISSLHHNWRDSGIAMADEKFFVRVRAHQNTNSTGIDNITYGNISDGMGWQATIQDCHVQNEHGSAWR